MKEKCQELRRDVGLSNHKEGSPSTQRAKLQLKDSKEIKPVSPKGNQSSIFSRRTNAEAEAPRFWPPDANSQLI